MDALPQAASSSVTVEYTDPSGLFSSVQPVIADKLPLRNLHWKSPTRPVRSIESLRIGFTPANHEVAERKPSSDAPGNAVTHRRHQIPGLRQTPYLKVYILRCDDNDTYKTTARKALREWIKLHGSSSTSTSTSATSQEKHDAFEWLILHVAQDGEGPEKAATASKWGRTTTTVLEKVKADFNNSSKSAMDRVAQLRLPRQGGAQQKSPELAEQIEDFVEKIKNGILASFDLRVAQYEEDIKEKDSQRSLPGWNFCTFFILKEGLARGFENVGLFEDALLGYDELAIGLDAAIHEQLEGSSAQHGSAFLTYSKDWQEKAKTALDARVEPEKPSEDGEVALIPDIDPADFPINPVKKTYREMILSSNISIFDFRTYIFSRQLTLLLRASRAPSLLGDDTDAGQKPGKKDKKPEDLLLLSEICERSTEFISLAARTLRSDLESGLEEIENDAKLEVISNLVSSWAYAAASQILLQTFTPALTLPESSLHAADMAQQKPDVPRRTSSLIMPTNRQSRAVKTEMVSPDALSSIHAQPGFEGPKLSPRTGSEQLASERGELLLMARRLLEEIAGRCGWKETWTDLGLLFDDSNPTSGDLDEISLDDENPQPVETPQQVNSLSGVDLPALKAGLGSRKAFRAHYEELTDRMYRHHIAANRTNSTHTALADMALLRYRQSDYGAAASYFHQIAPFYGNKLWTALEGVMLEMYARCLKELDRTEEYVRLVVRLLAKYAAHTQAQLSTRQKTMDASSIFAEQEFVSDYVEELFRASNALQKDVPASLTDFFADLHVKPVVLHYKDKDGFQLQLYLRFLLGKRIDVDSIKIRLVSAGGSGQSSEHWIEAPTKVTVKSSSTRILVDSTTTLQGKYFVDRVEMRAGNLVFTMAGGNQLALPVGFRESISEEEEDTRPYIYCYPHLEGLQAKIESPHLVNLEAMRTLELELNSGWNDIKTGIVRVRPATAGLRLRIAEAEIVEGDIEIKASTESGNIEFNELERNSTARFRIPYTVEEHPASLSARAEVTYDTEQGRFSYSSAHAVLFFSRFTVSPATMIPLWISKCSIPSSDVYQVQSNVGEAVAMRVFPKQPASLLYKIQPREDTVASPGARKSLRLSVDFTCIDDECFNTVEKIFKASISGSGFAQYTTLLTPHIVEAYRSQLSTSDLEVIGLVREIEALPYAAVRWEVLLGALKEPMDSLRAWLKEWHDNHLILTLPEQPSIRQRHIIIPVDIPEIQVVHTAELRITSLPEQALHAAVGQTITAELRLSHTLRWCSPDQRENAGGPLEFSYELHANPELWMVGGRRRGNFTASEGEMTTFAVLLLPQKSGHLLLPGLEIRSFVPPLASTVQSPSTTTGGPPAAVAAAATAGAAGLQRRPIPCEVDYRNHGETVLVLPDLRGTTVSLSNSGGHGGAWLIDSERRVQG